MSPSFNAFADELVKIAKEDKKRSPGWSIAKTVGKGALGFGLGTGVGYAGGELANLAARKLTGKNIPRKYLAMAAPVLGLGAATAYTAYKNREQKDIQRALKDHTDDS